MSAAVRNFFALVSFLAVALASGAAESPDGKASQGLSSPSSMTLVPREIFIGDEAVLTFPSATLERVLTPGERVSLEPSALPPPSDSATVRSVVLSRGPGEGDPVSVSVTFVAWNVGTVNLPSIGWKGIAVPPPAVTVASLAERTGAVSLEPPRAPLLVPGTTWLVYGFVSVAILASIFLWLLARRLLALAFGDPAARRAARRVREVRSALFRLERRIRRQETLSWHAELSRVFRGYLSLVAGDSRRAFEALTPAEIERSLTGNLRGYPCLGDMRSRLEGIDRVRFSGRPAVETRREDIAALRELVADIERAAKGEEANGRV